MELTGIPPGHGGRIDVAADLTVPGYSDVFAIGDVANVPGLRPAAPSRSSGRSLSSPEPGRARTSARSATGSDARPFEYHDKGIMAMVGRNAAVAEIGRHRRHLEGPLAFAAWLGLHAALLSGFHDRVDAVMNWADDYINRVARRRSGTRRVGRPDRVGRRPLRASCRPGSLTLDPALPCSTSPATSEEDPT